MRDTRGSMLAEMNMNRDHLIQRLAYTVSGIPRHRSGAPGGEVPIRRRSRDLDAEHRVLGARELFVVDTGAFPRADAVNLVLAAISNSFRVAGHRGEWLK